MARFDLRDSGGQFVARSRSREAAHRETRRARHSGSHLRLVHNRAAGPSGAARPGFVQWGGRNVFPREFHLPKEARGKTPIRIEDLEVYLYEAQSHRDPSKTLYGAVAFAGKAQKPLWHHSFSTEKGRDQKIADTIKSRRYVRKRKETESAAKKAFKHSVSVGDIFDTSWGYDQTNVEFVQVVEVRGSDLIVREIAQSSTQGGERDMRDRVVGIKDKFIGPPIRVRPTASGGVKFKGHHASKWDGSPQYTSSYA